MGREEAAQLLGVPADADPDTIRHAWRLWARVAHPDVGGDPAHFARLDEARRVLQRPRTRSSGRKSRRDCRGLPWFVGPPGQSR